jgi:integrase
MLFKDFFINFLISLDGSTKSRTFYSTVAAGKHIVAGLGNYHMDEINKTVLREFINGFTKKQYTIGKGKNSRKEYYSQSEIHKIYQLLHSAIKEAADEDGDHLLRIDFMANIKEPRSNRPMRPEPKALTDSEITLLLGFVSEVKMISVWVLVMLYTGVRPSEALALKFSDIDYNNKTVHIVRTLSEELYVDVKSLSSTKPQRPIITDLKNVRKGNRLNYQKRTLKVGNVLLKVFKEWENYVKSNRRLMNMKRRNGTAEYLFCGSHGQFWLYDDYKQVYARLLKKNGLNPSLYNPYRFRHNCCIRLLRMGVNLKATQMILGDNSPDMVMRVYANLDKSDVLEGSQNFSNSLDTILGIA